MATPAWQPGKIYGTGAIVKPRSTGQVSQPQPDNPSFEVADLDDWTAENEQGAGTWTIVSTLRGGALPFEGSKAVKFEADAAGTGIKNAVYGILKNNYLAPVRPGQTFNFSVYVSRFTAPNGETQANGGARVYWYNSSEEELTRYARTNAAPKDGQPGGSVLLSNLGILEMGAQTGPVPDKPKAGLLGGDSDGGWVKVEGTAIAPPDAAFARFAIVLWDNAVAADTIFADAANWDYTFQGFPDGLVFRATQALAGTSAESEPVWPTTSGATVVDNDITWEAVYVSRIIWAAVPLLYSDDSEPVWPTETGQSIQDGSPFFGPISWKAMSRRVEDTKCPHSTIVLTAASKIFAADDDIIAFSATVNPLDWSSPNDAGFLPTGLQAYGSTSMQGLGLYNSNLVAMNSQGYQIWQVDEDPANNALLDAKPVGLAEGAHKSIQAYNNDMPFLSAQGIRTIGVAGGSTNLQADDIGKQIDVLVKAAMAEGETPRGLSYPGAGQYWLFFGAEAFVLTNNGKSESSWSRYVFPAAIDAWCILDNDLYLRAGDVIWKVTDEALTDNESCVPGGVGDLVAGTEGDFVGYRTEDN